MKNSRLGASDVCRVLSFTDSPIRRFAVSPFLRFAPVWLLATLFLLFLLPLSAQAQDQDGDLMPDAYELAHFCLNVSVPDGNIDYDLDAMTNLQEFQYTPLLNPCAADTDGDDLSDGWEYQFIGCGFNPVSWDSEKFYIKPGSDLRVPSAFSSSESPSLAWTGSEYGVSWMDLRNDWDGICDLYSGMMDCNYEIYFSRVSADGVKIGPELRVTSQVDESEYPSLSWTGSEFGLSWDDNPDMTYHEIYFARVSAAGAKLGSDLRVTMNSSTSLNSSLAWTGSEFGMSWRDYSDGNWEIYFARVSAAGVKIGADVRMTRYVQDSVYPSLAWTGSEFGVSWNDNRDGNAEIYFARVSADGVKIASDLRITYASSNSEYSSLAWTGTEFGVGWQENRDGNPEIYFARLSRSGDKIGADLRVTSNSSYSWYPSLAWAGSEFGVSWNDYRDGNFEIYFARISAAGAKTVPDLRVTSDAFDSLEPSLAWTGSEFGVSWTDYRDGDAEIYFAGIAPRYTDKDGDGLTEDGEFAHGANPCLNDTDGDLMKDGFEATFQSCAGLDPLLAGNTTIDPDADGLSNLVEAGLGTNPCNQDTDGDVMKDGFEAMYRSCAGLDPLLAGSTTIDPDADGLSNLGEGNAGTNPCNPDTDGDLIQDGFETTYQSCAGLDPLLAGNTAMDPDADDLSNLAEASLATNPCNPDTDGDVLPDGWEHQYFSCGFDPLSSASELPGKIGADLLVAGVTAVSQGPSLAWTGSEFGISWEDNRDNNYEIYFGRVSPSGAKIGADLRVTNDVNASYFPSLAWTGSEFGVSWYDYRDGKTGIYFARVSRDGAKLGSDLRVTSAGGYSFFPSLSWTGSEFGMSWHDNRDGNYEIYFARVSADGIKIGSDLRITYAASNSEYSSLAWTGSEYGVSWHDNRDGNYEIYFARASADGVKIGSDLRVTSAGNDSYISFLAWTGSEFGLAWYDNRDGNTEIYFARLSPDGTKIGSDRRVTNNSAGSSSPSLAWTGSEFGVSWNDHRDGNDEIYFARVSPEGDRVGSDLRVTSTGNYSLAPAMAWTGTEFGVSWTEGYNQVFFARIYGGWYTDKDSDDLREEVEYALRTNPCLPDTDGDGMPDGWEADNSLNPLLPNGGLDQDNDGLSNLDEYQNGTSPQAWDTDGDALPDGYEVVHAGSTPALDPNNALDGPAHFDSDGNSNVHEFWNGSDPWAAEPTGGPGCCYWGDAGLGDRIVSPTDAIELKKALSGGVGNYTGVIPNTGETHELDMDGYISPLDLIILQKMIVQAAIPVLGSRPASLEILEAPGATVAVGLTCHVTVGAKNESTNPTYNYTPGLGVLFEIVTAQSTGTATILGGEGAAPPASRYDISGPIASSGSSRIALRIDSAGTITLRARLPACGMAGIGRSSPEIILDPAAVIIAQ